MIPKTNGPQTFTGETFPLRRGALRVAREDEYTAVFRQRAERLPLMEVPAGEPITLITETDPGLHPEEYILRLTPKKITVTAGSGAGVAQGLTTLYWLLRVGGGVLPAGELRDEPALAYRGFLLDPARHFQDVETVCRMIEGAALVKLNRLHWHLSDDQGYRLESRAFPRLNTVGSVRTQPDGSVHGGYYTFDEVRDIISFAHARGIEIVPELDLPGHTSALIAAYPSLSCTGEPMAVPTAQGVYPRILCAGKGETLDFLKALLGEIAPLFPYEYVHLGGDEAPKEAWQRCPRCQARRQALGLRDEDQLQRRLLGEVCRTLAELGKRAILWNDVLSGGPPEGDAVLEFWQAQEGVTEGPPPGQKWIYAGANDLYLDYPPCVLPLRKVYALEPAAHGGGAFSPRDLWGIECALWGEEIETRGRLEELAFPRLFAAAERGWSRERDYGDFKNRCRSLIGAYLADGAAAASLAEAALSGAAQKNAVVAHYRPVAEERRRRGKTTPAKWLRTMLTEKLADQFPATELAALIDKALDE